MSDTSNTMARRVVMLGAPGSGKGTQAERLVAALGVPAISTGEMLREAVAAGSPLGRRVAEIMTSGALVDDATMAEVVEARLEQPDAEGGFLLDGYPRTLDQAEVLDRILAEGENRLDAVVFIDVPEAELVQRALARQRADDTEETIRRRIAIYREKTEPLVDLYRQRGLLREVVGVGGIDEIAASVLTSLEGSA